jgi:hypothetical protein
VLFIYAHVDQDCRWIIHPTDIVAAGRIVHHNQYTSARRKERRIYRDYNLDVFSVYDQRAAPRQISARRGRHVCLARYNRGHDRACIVSIQTNLITFSWKETQQRATTRHRGGTVIGSSQASRTAEAEKWTRLPAEIKLDETTTIYVDCPRPGVAGSPIHAVRSH